MDKKIKILFVSDSSRIKQVGQSVVSRNTLTRLQALGYEVENLGFLDSKIRPEETTQVPYNVIDCTREDMFNLPKMVEFIKASDPDVVICSHDPWCFDCTALMQIFPTKRFLGWITIDGDPLYYAWRRNLKGFHKVISPTNYGKRVIQERYSDINVDVVPYGIDFQQNHYPQQGKEQLKKQLSERNHHLGDFGSLEGKFVGIYIGANQDRKNLGVIHEAWRQFEKGKEDKAVFMMFVHSAALSSECGAYDLVVFIQDTKTLRIINSVQPDEIIGAYMAAADVLVHPSAGEGFGLTVSNAMACGTVPIILPFAGVTDFCTPENCYPVSYIEHVGGYHVHRAITSAENLAEVIQFAYDNPEDRLAKSKKCVEDSMALTWEKSVQGIDRNIKEVLAMPDNGLYFAKVC